MESAPQFPFSIAVCRWMISAASRVVPLGNSERSGATSGKPRFGIVGDSTSIWMLGTARKPCGCFAIVWEHLSTRALT